jgi:hypothetical protein
MPITSSRQEEYWESRQFDSININGFAGTGGVTDDKRMIEQPAGAAKEHWLRMMRTKLTS